MAEIEDSGNQTPESGEISTLFGKYEVGRLLGCGAFAKVYHARNIQSGQSFAIKCISKQKIIKGGLTSHIKREISIMRRMNHPHIVKLFEVLATKSKIYFVMEYVKGGELFDKVAQGRLTENLSRRYFQQLISAVEYCHLHGVFHRDLKPENLLLAENGDLKVSDFGLSAVTEQIRNDGLLHTLCGTPAYVAPEILAKKGYDGAKIDIWSCGIILYVLTAGYLPFNDPNLMVMYRKIYKGEFRCPRWMSADLKRFLSRLLDPNPETRITIDEILRDPWFKKGYKPVKVDEDFGVGEKKQSDDKFLTAFDLISFSSGFDLSGLFSESSSSSSVSADRVASTESPERIIEKIEEFAKKEENVSVKRKDWNVVIKGQNGNCATAVDVYRLTESLAMVEVRSSDGMWRKKICDLIRQPESPVWDN